MEEKIKKQKDKEYKKLKTKLTYIFIWKTKLNQIYNMLLNIEFFVYKSWNLFFDCSHS